ncbi:MAG: DUF3794 domain-containing protein [Oscillospiraceae bacterium]|nr:DUF3794 domain-containing protein [Oscillospiraceae bacterium]
MDIKVGRETVAINNIIFDAKCEQAIECDLMLPDYNPDIQRILKCEVTPKITSKYINQNKLAIEGFAVIRVIYQTPENAVRCAENKMMFSKEVDLKQNADGADIRLTPSVDYCNCRAINQRRIDIRGAISIKITVTGKEECEVISSCEGAGVQTKKNMVSFSVMSFSYSRAFNIKENVDIGFLAPKIGAIVFSKNRVRINDYKVIANKIIAKGEVQMHLLYNPDENYEKLEKLDISVPFNQIIDAEGVLEEQEVELLFDILNFELISSDESENNIVVADIAINCEVRGFKKQSVAIITDSYSTLYEMSSSTKSISFDEMCGILNEPISINEVISFDKPISEIVDVWAIPNIKSIRTDDDMLVIYGVTEQCIICKDEEGQYMFTSKNIDFEYKKNISQGIGIKNVRVCELSNSFVISSIDKAEIRCELQLTYLQNTMAKCNPICEMQIDEASPKKQKSENALTIYYADKDESVWNIAKRYNTSITAVVDENGLVGDTLEERSMLLIPMIY